MRYRTSIHHRFEADGHAFVYGASSAAVLGLDDTSNEILSHFAQEDGADLDEWRERVRKGGEGAPGYGHIKQRLIESIDTVFGPARERREELLARPDEIDEILAAGADKARARARKVRDRALAACGLR